MRPTISEQLDGLRRILAETVAPEITAPYPAEILGSVIASLTALSEAVYTVPAYLRWDIGTATALLEQARPFLDPALAAEIAADPEYDPLDLRALEGRQAELHALLAKAMPIILQEPALAGVKADMVAFFRARAERYPFSMVARPAPKKE
jgi:hypothetical protein